MAQKEPPELPDHLRGYFPEPGDQKIFQQNLLFEDEFEREREHGFDFRLTRDMERVGIPPRARRATLDTVPAEIRKLATFTNFPKYPFGLTGPGGCGKSCAIAFLVREYLRKDYLDFGPTKLIRVSRQTSSGFQGIPEEHHYQPSLDFIWLNWPARAVMMKHLASRREWTHPEVSLLGIMDKIKADPQKTVVIIDDFGMENIKGEKAYVQEQLELLIDTAYNHEARVFWTSNHTVETLGEERLYGYRMMSRMAGLSPDTHLPQQLPDLRVRSAYA